MEQIASSQREGYWYTYPAMEPELYREGSLVKRIVAEPPWLVVDQFIGSVIVAARHWPGQLWRVRVDTLGDMSGLVKDIWYCRATAIELIEELPLSTLFGPHGEAVLSLINQASTLSSEQAESLLPHIQADGWAVYSRAWNHWSEIRRSTPSNPSKDWQGVIAAPNRHDREQAPINTGFSLISELIRQRARTLEGHAAFVLETDENGETEESLAPKWQAAMAAFMQAAMALGAPQHVSSEADHAVLTHAWRQVFQAD